MGKSKQTISRKEYIDDDGWKVLELTAPNFSTVFKTRDNHCIYINNGEIIHEGPYTSNIKLSDFIDMSIDQFVDGLFEEDEVIDLEEVPKGIGTTYKYEPKKKKKQKRRTRYWLRWLRLWLFHSDLFVYPSKLSYFGIAWRSCTGYCAVYN